MYSVGEKIINNTKNVCIEYEIDKYIGHGVHGLVYSVKNLKSLKK